MDRVSRNSTFPGAEDWVEPEGEAGGAAADAAAAAMDPFDDAEARKLEAEVSAVAARVKVRERKGGPQIAGWSCSAGEDAGVGRCALPLLRASKVP